MGTSKPGCWGLRWYNSINDRLKEDSVFSGFDWLEIYTSGKRDDEKKNSEG